MLGKFRSGHQKWVPLVEIFEAVPIFVPFAAGQRRSKSVNAGQSWSTPVNAGQLSPNFGRSPFRPIFDVPDMFTTSDLRYEISKVKNGD
ncbi:hypothetical protein TIFTF001_052167 [Ficus carica]|uniref:Uncharacterized protein n=1 Tax=Ficus carica TaxID=3494 RepID=A0AA88EEI4_FICCA|nr:hypothetical protein TIFTF001_052166 [Ficus carica]GMN73389.1 hypothetical protein TIFTF001_052167 [Ficus carica]